MESLLGTHLPVCDLFGCRTQVAPQDACPCPIRAELDQLGRNRTIEVLDRVAETLLGHDAVDGAEWVVNESVPFILLECLQKQLLVRTGSSKPLEADGLERELA